MPDVLQSELEQARPRRFRPYPKYKDSGVEWLGEIPAHWDIPRMWRISRAVSGGTPAKAEPLYWDGEIPWVSPKDMKRRLIGSSEDCITERAVSETGLRLLAPPVVLIVVRGMILAHSFPVALTTVPVTINQDMKAIAFKDGIDPLFMVWVLEGLGKSVLAAIVEEAAHGTRAIRMDEWRLVKVALPEASEQRAIVSFLDRETAKIDELVARNERLIELLKEKRTALLTRAVTRGLDPSVPMKDSGVEWLGEIPAHWDAERVSWIARMESGHTPDKKVDAYWADESIPWVSLNDSRYLKAHDYIRETAYFTNELGLSNSSARLLPARAVVFSRDATIGLCAITEREMAVSQHFIAWICEEYVRPEYLLRIFDAMQDELERLTMGATLRTIGMPDVKTLMTPVPPLQEQDEIVSYIREQRCNVDRLIAKTQEATGHLKEFRTALISAAVTGKIDVREGAA